MKWYEQVSPQYMIANYSPQYMIAKNKHENKLIKINQK